MFETTPIMFLYNCSDGVHFACILIVKHAIIFVVSTAKTMYSVDGHLAEI